MGANPLPSTMKRNFLEEYRKLSKKVSAEFDQYLLNCLKKREDKDSILMLYKKFLDTKIGEVHDRIVHVYIAGKVFGLNPEEKKEEFLRLMVPPELMIWSNYALNWVTDQKNNISGTKTEENLDLVASQYLATEVLYFLPDHMLRRYFEVYRWVMESYLTVETLLKITNFKNLEKDDDYWLAYARHHAIPGVGGLYAYCFGIVKEYFNIDIEAKILNKISKILLEYGRCMQINNDLSEFMLPDSDITTTEKRKTDYFIDIRTDRLSYGVWLIMRHAKENNKSLYQEILASAQDGKYLQNFFESLTTYIKQYRILDKGINLLKHEYKRLYNEVEKLPLNSEGKHLWQMSLLTLVNNKFLRKIKEDYSY